jgi:simple sugar transport system substrate-binding protein
MALALCVAVILAVSVAACGDDTDENSEASNADGGSESSGEGVKVGLVLMAPDDFFLRIQEGGEAAAEKQGATVTTLTGQSATDVQDQINKLNDLMSRGVDALVVSANGPGVTPTLERAVEQGIKVVLVNSDLPDFEGKTAYVGTDNAEGGTILGKYVVEQLKGKGTVGILEGEANIPVLDDRVNGFKKELEGTDIEVVAALPMDCDADKGFTATQDLLTSHPDVDALYAACAYGPVGGVKAMEQAKRPQGLGPGKTLFVSYDICGPLVQLTEEGKLQAGVTQEPGKMGEKSVEIAIAAVNGTEPAEKFVDTGVSFVTKDNAAKYADFC